MEPLTPRQRAILGFIEDSSRTEGIPPTFREIASHFRFRSVNAVRGHVQALARKGYLRPPERQARSLRVIVPQEPKRRPVADIPLFGAIPAGFAEGRSQEPIGCVSLDIGTLGLRPTPRTFALKVSGDSMIGRHILDGDIVVCEHGRTPASGDVVAALIDNESTLKTFVRERGRAWLKAENPAYPKLIPAAELVIQGVVVAVIRRFAAA